jgi:hypothetical protein
MSGLESRTEYEVAVRHVKTTIARPFEQVKAALEQVVPPLNEAFLAHLRNGRVEQAVADLDSLAPLSIFGTRDHGAALYAPLRVLLYEDEAGQAVFEYDRPISTFGQFGSEEINKTAEMLEDLPARRVTEAAEAARP